MPSGRFRERILCGGERIAAVVEQRAVKVREDRQRLLVRRTHKDSVGKAAVELKWFGLVWFGLRQKFVSCIAVHENHNRQLWRPVSMSMSMSMSLCLYPPLSPQLSMPP